MNASRGPLVFALSCLLTSLLPRSALAEDAPPFAGSPSSSRTAAARTALEEQRYPDALALVRADFESDDAARRAEAFEIAAIALLLDARPAEAALYLRALYELAPAFRLADPSLPPRVTSPFEAEAARPHERAVALAIEADNPAAGYMLTLSRPAERVDVLCRPGSGGAFASVSVVETTATRARFTLPTAGLYGCFALASGAGGLPLGRLGTREHPVWVKPAPPPPSSSVLSSWWFWTAVGAVVVGGTAVAIVETRPRDVASPHADLTVRAHGFTLR